MVPTKEQAISLLWKLKGKAHFPLPQLLEPAYKLLVLSFKAIFPLHFFTFERWPRLHWIHLDHSL